MIKVLLLAVLLVGCVEDGINGIDGIGIDGNNYYTYEQTVSIQEIIGEDPAEFTTSDGDYYKLPESITMTVDNMYNCELNTPAIIIESGDLVVRYEFEQVSRYEMKSIDVDRELILDSSDLVVYYEVRPVAFCGEDEYELHSGIDFKIRVIKELVIEEEE